MLLLIGVLSGKFNLLGERITVDEGRVFGERRSRCNEIYIGQKILRMIGLVLW